jgi:hypothetical protein
MSGAPKFRHATGRMSVPEYNSREAVRGALAPNGRDDARFDPTTDIAGNHC